MARYTQFIDFTDGTGKYVDHKTQNAWLKAHSRAVKNPKVIRSLVKDYGADEEGDAVAADFTRKSEAA